MGYTTYFGGQFTVTPELKPEHRAYLTAFSASRRMKRSVEVVATLPDPIREAAGLPLGDEAGYYVGNEGEDLFHVPAGKDWKTTQEEAGILDYNREPSGQPGLWCPWEPDQDGDSTLCIPEGGKHYGYVEWLEYIIEHFLKPWGYVLSGDVSYDGEDTEDKGVIWAKDNQVEQVQNVNPGPSWGNPDA